MKTLSYLIFLLLFTVACEGFSLKKEANLSPPNNLSEDESEKTGVQSSWEFLMKLDQKVYRIMSTEEDTKEIISLRDYFDTDINSSTFNQSVISLGESSNHIFLGIKAFNGGTCSFFVLAVSKANNTSQELYSYDFFPGGSCSETSFNTDDFRYVGRQPDNSKLYFVTTDKTLNTKNLKEIVTTTLAINDIASTDGITKIVFPPNIVVPAVSRVDYYDHGCTSATLSSPYGCIQVDGYIYYIGPAYSLERHNITTGLHETVMSSYSGYYTFNESNLKIIDNTLLIMEYSSNSKFFKLDLSGPLPATPVDITPSDITPYNGGTCMAEVGDKIFAVFMDTSFKYYLYEVDKTNFSLTSLGEITQNTTHAPGFPQRHCFGTSKLIISSSRGILDPVTLKFYSTKEYIQLITGKNYTATSTLEDGMRGKDFRRSKDRIVIQGVTGTTYETFTLTGDSVIEDLNIVDLASLGVTPWSIGRVYKPAFYQFYSNNGTLEDYEGRSVQLIDASP